MLFLNLLGKLILLAIQILWQNFLINLDLMHFLLRELIKKIKIKDFKILIWKWFGNLQNKMKFLHLYSLITMKLQLDFVLIEDVIIVLDKIFIEGIFKLKLNNLQMLLKIWECIINIILKFYKFSDQISGIEMLKIISDKLIY